MTVEPGLAAVSARGYTVTEADTAAALGSGEVPLLAIPAVLAPPNRPPWRLPFSRFRSRKAMWCRAVNSFRMSRWATHALGIR
jgi:hypothetical protein